MLVCTTNLGPDNVIITRAYLVCYDPVTDGHKLLHLVPSLGRIIPVLVQPNVQPGKEVWQDTTESTNKSYTSD